MPSLEGQQIGAYELLSPLGQGGMATVYKAFHPRLNRYVAIKMIHAGYAEEQSFLKRFEREAQIVAALEHPNIVPVYDFFEHQNNPCLVMKFIDGITLKGALGDGALFVEDVLNIMPKIAQALDYAHGQGVLHRDIKPSNILLDTKGVPYISDFGLAKLAQAGDTTISENMLIGTPFYMSPEQGTAGGEVTPRSDLYSLGVLMYELLVGRVPYREGTPYAIIHDHIYKPLPMPSELNPNITPSIEYVLLRALSKDPADRFASADEMISALQNAVTEHGIGAINDASRHTLLTSIAARSAQVPVGPTPLPQRTPIDMKTFTPTPPTFTQTAQAGSAAQTIVQQPTPAWMWVAFGIGMLALAIIVIGAAILSRPPAQMSGQQQLVDNSGLPVGNIADVQPLVILDLSVEEAQQQLDANPTSEIAYLTLANAQLHANDVDGAETTVRSGFQYASNPVAYLVTAGNSAVTTDNFGAALLAYGWALSMADSSTMGPLRPMIGEQLYNLALTTQRLTAFQIRSLNDLRTTQVEYRQPLISVMIARALLTMHLDGLCEAVLNNVGLDQNALQEALLVRGDLEAYRGDITSATATYERILAYPRMPEWVRMRAQQSLNSLSGG